MTDEYTAGSEMDSAECTNCETKIGLPGEKDIENIDFECPECGNTEFEEGGRIRLK